jgi:hypothetical protein
VYLDTTIPSYAVDDRKNVVVGYRCLLTNRFLGVANRFDFWVSEVVRAELARGSFPNKARALAMIADLPDVPLTAEVVEVAEYFREHQLVPSYDIGDSLHLALAVVHRLGVLATWNFRHLANPRKRRHLAVLCRRLSLSASDVVSPEELLEED